MNFRNCQDRLKNADVLDEPVEKGPLYQKTLGVANGKILLIGDDAAGFFDPNTGEGIDFSARQALLLEKYEEPVLKENSGNLVKAMFDYSRASAQIYRRYQIMTSLVLLLRLWPKLTDGVIQVLHSFPALFQKLLSVNMR